MISLVATGWLQRGITHLQARFEWIPLEIDSLTSWTSSAPYSSPDILTACRQLEVNAEKCFLSHYESC